LHDIKLPHTKRITRGDMLPHELAELALAEWKSSDATATASVFQHPRQPRRPARRAFAHPLQNERGLPIERVMIDAKDRLILQYEAAGNCLFSAQPA
jgi:hypothetical protein